MLQFTRRTFMKQTILFLAVALIFAGCASSSTKDNSAQTSDSKRHAYTENGIVDEEFDLLIAPEYDYETEVPYEEQIKNTPVTKKGAVAKPVVKPTKKPATAN